MATLDLERGVITDLDSRQGSISVTHLTTEGVGDQKETRISYPLSSKYLGYYHDPNVAEFKISLNAYATWVIGRGWKSDPRTTTILEGIQGMGEDSFASFVWNMIVTKKLMGDAFAEIIRDDEGVLINLKPLDTGRMVTILNEQGIIERYEQTKGIEGIRKLRRDQVFHLMNDRIMDSPRGTSIGIAAEWTFEALKEVLEDQRKVMRRNLFPLRVIEVDTQDATKIAKIKADYENVIIKGEVMIVPKGNVAVIDSKTPLQDPLPYINLLINRFYQILGVPKVVLGGGGLGEGDNKMSYLSYEQVYVREVEEFKADFWNQVAHRLEFPQPVSLKDKVQDTQDKNTSQVGLQPNETQAGVGE